METQINISKSFELKLKGVQRAGEVLYRDVGEDYCINVYGFEGDFPVVGVAFTDHAYLALMPNIIYQFFAEKDLQRWLAGGSASPVWMESE